MNSALEMIWVIQVWAVDKGVKEEMIITDTRAIASTTSCPRK